MAIEVRCPQGHRLKCPDDRAGMRGKCPKCGTSFEVPKTNGQAATRPSAEEVAVGAEVTSVTASSESGKRRIRDAASEEKIQFFCPNGHKLSGPASLQGMPGQCPHCHAKFLIPHLDEDEDEEHADEAPAGDAGGIAIETDEPQPEPVDDEFLGLDDLQEVEQGSGRGSDPTLDSGFLPEGPDLPGAEPPVDAGHPLAGLFVTLWQEHEHGGVVEIHLTNGVTIVPDWWAPALSLNSHGVFAIQTADGSYVMESVAWDAVQRITIRRIKELPGGVFE